MKMLIRVVITIFGVLIILSLLGLVKGLQIGRMTAHGEAFVPPPQTVTAAPVKRTTWDTSLHAVGSLASVQGVEVTAELSGKVARIAFSPGSRVAAGQLLLQQDITAENAQLQAAQSDARLALKNLQRSRKLLSQNVIPKATLDEAQAEHDKAAAQVDLIRALIAKKTIRAPFAGRLGIRLVNLGEFLASGQPIVSLEAIDEIYANFQLPQQELVDLAPGLSVRISSDTLEGQVVAGTITALDPAVDSRTRNIKVQATIPNPGERLRAGMYVTVTVVLPVQRTVVTIPTTAVQYAPYSDSVFVVEKTDKGSNQQQLVVRQQFVKLGEKRGDFVVVKQGLKAGQRVVSTGVFKLRNGQAVVVDNSLAPTFETTSRPEDA